MPIVKHLLIILTLNFLLISCKKNSEKGDPDVPYFFEISFNNIDTIKIKEGKEGYQNGFGSGDFADSIGTYFERQSTTFQGGKFKATVYFIQSFPFAPNQTDIEGMFHVGYYSFGKSYVSPFIDGVEILWIDSLSHEWWTSKGSQTGSQFVITKHEANSYDNFSPFATSVNFNCTLFNGAGDSILANGSFLGRTVSY